MNKVTITTKRLIQQLYPFLGKIVFTLQGDNSELVTSFIPEVSIFCNGYAISHLVPNSLIKDATTYYHYAIYPQGHVPGIFLSEPVEEGDCIVPDNDCNLDDILAPVPAKEDAQSIIAQAMSYIAEIREAVEEARNCAIRSCECASASSQHEQDTSELLNESRNISSSIKAREEQINQEIDNFLAQLGDYEQTLKSHIETYYTNRTIEFLNLIRETQVKINDIWTNIQEKYEYLRQYEEVIRDLQELLNERIQDILDNQEERITALENKTTVTLKGDKVAISQLPSNASDGDTWFIPTKQAFYVFYDGNWHCISIKRQADTIQAAPQNEIELAVLTAAIEEGGHLTLVINN